jgi:hypothetical protein
MAKSQYSADSASLPQPPLPSDGNRMGTFKTAGLPTSFLKDALPVPTTFVVTDMSAYIGKSADLGCRLSEHRSVRRNVGKNDTPAPTSID